MTTITEMLKKIRECPARTKTGICSQDGIVFLDDAPFELLKDVMAKWPKYSGSRLYPVPVDEDNKGNPTSAYYFYKELWDKNTEYGRLRWELLDWLIEQPELDVEPDTIRSKNEQLQEDIHR